MPLQGFGVGARPPQDLIPDQAPDFDGLVKSSKQLAARLAPRPALKRWKSSNASQQGSTAGYQKSGTSFIVNTDQDMINSLTVTVIAGTLWIYLIEADPGSSAAGVPDYVCGAMTPVQPIVIPIQLDRYCLTLYAASADCQYSVIGQAL